MMPWALSRALSCSHLCLIPIKETNGNNKQQVSNLALAREATSPKGSLCLVEVSSFLHGKYLTQQDLTPTWEG